MSNQSSVGDRYVLATGEIGARRLALLNAVYGQSSRHLLTTSGVSASMRGVDFGCGTGNTTSMIASLVGPTGHVTGIDASADQLQLARQQASASGLSNTTFLEASVYNTGLPRNEFDFVYGRLILCHLQKPLDMLREMLAILKPGGLLISEDLDIRSLASDPPHDAYKEVVELSLKTAQQRGVDYGLGSKLHQLYVAVGLQPRILVFQPAFAVGEEKRVWEYTFLEAAPQMVIAGLTTQESVERLREQLAAIAADPNYLVFLTRFVQAWATKQQ